MVKSHQLETLIGYHLRRASSAIMADLAERLSEVGLTTTEASILVIMEADAGLTQSEIGRRLAIKRANMAPLIATLVARGLIVRGEPSGRAHPLHLSRKGSGLAADARRRMEGHEADFFGDLPAEKQALLRSVLNELWRTTVER